MSVGVRLMAFEAPVASCGSNKPILPKSSLDGTPRVEASLMFGAEVRARRRRCRCRDDEHAIMAFDFIGAGQVRAVSASDSRRPRPPTAKLQQADVADDLNLPITSRATPTVRPCFHRSCEFMEKACLGSGRDRFWSCRILVYLRGERPLVSGAKKG